MSILLFFWNSNINYDYQPKQPAMKVCYIDCRQSRTVAPDSATSDHIESWRVDKQVERVDVEPAVMTMLFQALEDGKKVARTTALGGFCSSFLFLCK